MTDNKVMRYETAAGRSIYTFPVLAFAELVANIYLIDDGNGLTLIDCGSGLEESNKELLAGFEALGSRYGKAISLKAVKTIVITHGHIDHFGGLPFVRQFTDAPIGVHPLDRRVLSHYEERVVVASRQLKNFLERAGVSDQETANSVKLLESDLNVVLTETIPKFKHTSMEVSL